MNINEAIDLLHEEGHQVTDRRKEILKYFDRADGYRTAKDLHEHMEDKYLNISFDTVYRNLHLYNTLNILETTELNGEKNFRLNCADHHHHHFICNDCGKTKKINICPMEALDQTLNHYYIEDHKFEIYGLCPGCYSA